MENYSTVTRKGQITLPAEVRKRLKIHVGDRVAITLVEGDRNEETSIVIRPIRSVAERMFGSVRPLKSPEDFKELRREFEEGTAEGVAAEGSDALS